MRCAMVVVLTIVILQPISNGAIAQPVVETRVGSWSGQPLVITKFDAQNVAQLARAAGVPMGIEMVGERSQRLKIPATGRPLGQVLEAMVAAQPEYEWREVAGVIVFRPKSAWASAGFLDGRVGPLTLSEVDSRDVLLTLQRLLGFASPSPTASPGDSKRFSVNLPADGSFLDLLNAIVRAHGALAWGFEHQSPRPQSMTRVWLGGAGVGSRIFARRFDRAQLTVSGARRSPTTSILEAVIGPTLEGDPLRISAFSTYSINRLADATGVPMGFQELAPGSPVATFPYVAVTGTPLIEVLNWLTRFDSRYHWREMDGVVVFRPTAAWSDPNDPLFRPIPRVELQDATTSDAISVPLSLFGGHERRYVHVSDSRRFSVHSSGTLIDLLNAIVKAHGEMMWTWSDLDAEEQQRYDRRYRLGFYMFLGGGGGWTLR